MASHCTAAAGVASLPGASSPAQKNVSLLPSTQTEDRQRSRWKAAGAQTTRAQQLSASAGGPGFPLSWPPRLSHRPPILRPRPPEASGPRSASGPGPFLGRRGRGTPGARRNQTAEEKEERAVGGEKKGRRGKRLGKSGTQGQGGGLGSGAPRPPP